MDRTTKILLAVIALGLWANLLKPIFRPPATYAQNNYLESIDHHLSTIEHDVHNLMDIGDGKCRNSKICD
jgi:hypothetical protein